MRFFVVWTILVKELLETLRDRRTLLRVLLLPMVVYPLFAIGVSKFQGAQVEERQARPSRVALWGDPPAEVREGLLGQDKFVFVDWGGAPAELRARWHELELPPGTDPDAPEAQETSPKGRRAVPLWWVEPPNPALEAARAALAGHEIEAVLAFWPRFSATMEGEQKARVAVYFDQVEPDSMLARERLERALRLVRKGLVREREERRGLPRGFSQPYEIVTRSAAVEGRSGGQILGAMMPMMLILMALLGGFLPAIDLTAGEKERGTMQTLLCAPLRPIEIISGKFLAVFVISLLTALINIVSLALTMRRILPSDVPVPLSTYGLTLLLLVPVTFLFSALFLAMATFARDFKDGQNVLMPVYLPLTLLAGITSLPGIELNRGTALAPVLNIALLIKALFLDEARVELAFAVLASSAVYAALALALAARVFSQETILLGGATSWRSLLGLGEGKGKTPGPGFALTTFALALVALFYGSVLFERIGLIPQHLTAQYGFFLLVPLLGVLAYGFSLRDTFALRRPPPWALLGALLLGASAWSPVAVLVTKLLPPPPELAKNLEKLLLFEGASLPVVLLLGALTPAVCEEALFRGLIFGGLRPMGPAAALLGSSLLFALAHASVYRLLPTFILGAVMGLLRQRSGSLVPSMLFHATHNGLAVTLIYTRPQWAGSFLGANEFPPALLAGGLAVFAAGLAVALRRRAPAAA